MCGIIFREVRYTNERNWIAATLFSGMDVVIIPILLFPETN